jgi:hypothetical protein
MDTQPSRPSTPVVIRERKGHHQTHTGHQTSRISSSTRSTMDVIVIGKEKDWTRNKRQACVQDYEPQSSWFDLKMPRDGLDHLSQKNGFN